MHPEDLLFWAKKVNRINLKNQNVTEAPWCNKLFPCAVTDRRDQITVLTNGYIPSPKRMWFCGWCMCFSNLATRHKSLIWLIYSHVETVWDNGNFVGLWAEINLSDQCDENVHSREQAFRTALTNNINLYANRMYLHFRRSDTFKND